MLPGSLPRPQNLGSVALRVAWQKRKEILYAIQSGCYSYHEGREQEVELDVGRQGSYGGYHDLKLDWLV